MIKILHNGLQEKHPKHGLKPPHAPHGHSKYDLSSLFYSLNNKKNPKSPLATLHQFQAEIFL